MGDDAMGRFENQRIGLREKGTNKLIIAYPYKINGTDEQVSRRVKNWYYQTNCCTTDHLLKIFVDFLDDEELKQYSL